MTGSNHPHALSAAKRRFLPDLYSHHSWVGSEKYSAALRISVKSMRVTDKKGIDTVLAELRTHGEKY